MARKVRKSYVWVIAYVNKEYLDSLDKKLGKKSRFNKVEHYTPTVKILKKKFKGKDRFDIVPVLFNYGFFRIPKNNYNIPFLKAFKNYLSPGIYSWVVDPIKPMRDSEVNEKKGTIKRYPDCNIATASEKEITYLKKLNFQDSIYSSEDINLLQVGNLVTLVGYPFDNYIAKILDIDTKHKKLRVELQLGTFSKDVIISFANLLYTIYREDRYEPNSMRESYIEETKKKYR